MNDVKLMGRLTANPETTYTNDKKAITKLRLAVDDGKDRNGDKRAQFINCEAWEKIAELIDQYFSKGDPIIIHGKIRNDRWTDKDSKNRERTYVRITSIEWPLQKAKKSDTFTDIEESDADLPF